MAQNYPKWPKNDGRAYALFPQFFLTEKAVPQTFSLLECSNKLTHLLLAGDTQIYVSQNQALLSIFLCIIPTIVKLSCMIEKNRKSMGKGGGVACHPKPKRLFSGTMRTIHNCHCYTRTHLTTFHTLPIFIALPAPSSSCCHLTMKIKVLQFSQCKGHGVLLLIYSDLFFFRF